MRRLETRGFGALDLLVTLAFLALLVWLVSMDWEGRRRPPVGAPTTAIAAS